MRALGNSSLDFELMAWIELPELRGLVRHDLLMNIYKIFNQKGIEIPFPQTDIHVRSLPAATDWRTEPCSAVVLYAAITVPVFRGWLRVHHPAGFQSFPSPCGSGIRVRRCPDRVPR